MFWFFFSVVLLLAGYFIYGKIVDTVFGPNPNRKTPAIEMADGVDYVAMSDKKFFWCNYLILPAWGLFLVLF